METEEVQVLTLSPDPVSRAPVPELREDFDDTARGRPLRLRSRWLRSRWLRPRWPGRTAVTSVVGALILVTAVAASLFDHDRLQRTDASIATTRADLHRTLTEIAGARNRLAKAAQASGAAANALVTASTQLSAVQAQLTAAQTTIRLDGVNIADLDTCLTGVNQALNEISLGNQSGAAAILHQYEGSCQAAEPSG
jgi:hypothetical protein